VSGALLLAGALFLVLGSLLPVVAPIRLGLAAQAAGVTLIGLAGAIALWSGDRIGATFSAGLSPAFGVDRLSGVYLVMLGLVSGPVLVFASGYLEPSRRGRAVSSLTGLFVLMLVGLLCARDVVSFLVSWELMTLVPAAIILIWHADQPARRSVFVYAAVTHVAGAGVWLSLLVLAGHGALSGHALAASSSPGVLVSVAALIGFGAKAGVVPLHVWLPRAHPIAPAPVSALMSGVMLNVSLYGLMRVVLQWLAEPSIWLGIAVLALGATSALVGILGALFQGELKRLLAFSSIENVGIVLLGLGAALVLRSQGNAAWASIALAAALLHVLNHAFFKALLFLAAGSIDEAVHGLELNRLGGLLRRMPWTGGAFLVGAGGIAGIAPLGGFISEWLIMQALLHLAFGGSIAAGVSGALALAALATTAALSVFCFVKVSGLVLLGESRRPACARAVEAPRAMRAGVVVLAGWCVALSVAPGVIVERCARILPGSAQLGSAIRLDPLGSGGAPTLALAVAILVLVGALRLSRGGRVAAPAPVWASGQRTEPAFRWTSAGFTKPVRLVLEAILRPEREIVTTTRHGIVQSVSYQGRVPLLIDEHVYAPAQRLALGGAAFARRLQSGRLSVYVAYLIGLVVALLLCARIGVLG
jgi:hydrogenase-4 component B